MALTATSPRNPFVNDTYDGKIGAFATDLSGGNPFNQGDILCWDATLNSGNGGVRAVVNQADMANYVGVSNQTTPITSLGDKLGSVDVYTHARCRFKTTTGDTYKHLSKVFFNETVDVQTVTVSTNAGARTVAVGYVLLDNALIMAGTLTITGAAGQDVQVAITPAYPVAAGYL